MILAILLIGCTKSTSDEQYNEKDLYIKYSDLVEQHKKSLTFNVVMSDLFKYTNKGEGITKSMVADFEKKDSELTISNGKIAVEDSVCDFNYQEGNIYLIEGNYKVKFNYSQTNLDYEDLFLNLDENQILNISYEEIENSMGIINISIDPSKINNEVFLESLILQM
ncbi:hypothetical protein M2475_001816 [Breznakia sp. PF5-3]|uniref:hypothetical protein n=1 Tax=unclassified Breznakia TaxID=2623764 RepID=UPI0024055AF9|nr:MULTISPECIES: hypothetical protein [unclassified Breznakia]MDF9825361.1 hypothetical protein [Breznakia sp. PM6-1]MDF9836239.1 hypothetical protein [Breznakia sp. PF5-3]MDF9838521.1 hypothetical protein [Breznakia sp. PFB2-8]MDF9860484.1 hypothetical protein [Breznakia sp. PH5-24]